MLAQSLAYCLRSLQVSIVIVAICSRYSQLHTFKGTRRGYTTLNIKGNVLEVAAISYFYNIHVFVFSARWKIITLNDMYTIAYHAKSAFILSIVIYIAPL